MTFVTREARMLTENRQISVLYADGDMFESFEVEPYRGLARCILAIFQKYVIFAQF